MAVGHFQILEAGGRTRASVQGRASNAFMYARDIRLSLRVELHRARGCVLARFHPDAKAGLVAGERGQEMRQ